MSFCFALSLATHCIVSIRALTLTRAQCGTSLAVTGDHLIFTGAGLRAARDISVGDMVYGARDEECIVSATQSLAEGEYFGLNCLQSVVVANGIKASTFGRLHAVPALWMRLVGAVAGIERASRAGDFLASLAARVW